MEARRRKGPPSRALAAALAAAGLVASAACRPDVRGRCETSADCRDGASCALGGICIAASGTCTPECGEGQLCSGGACAALKPSLSIKPIAGGLVSPSLSHLRVHVQAPAGVVLHELLVEADLGHPVASGSVPDAVVGDDLVTLGGFEAGAVGPGTVFAELTYVLPSGATETVRSPAVAVTIDAAPPTVTVFTPGEADAVAGWVPRTAGTLEIRAQANDGAGAGPASATLTFGDCPAAAPCSYTGSMLPGASSGAAIFSFVIPRAAQAAGAEAPLAITVAVTDKAGNEGRAADVVRIDDAPPVVGAFSLVTPGAAGEDGHSWFPGGSAGPLVEIAVPISDSGVGVASLALSLVASDVTGPVPAVPAVSPAATDGTVHFRLPASAVQGREGALHFTLLAKDKLEHATAVPAGPQTAIYVDDAPPTVSAPVVKYLSASPAGVCAPDSGTFQCGRGPAAAPDHLLRDDSATVSFDVTDCGAGVGSTAQQGVTALSGGASHDLPVTSNGKSPTACANGSTNQTHHYQGTLVLAEHAPVLGASDPSGTAQVQLVGNGLDKVSHLAHGSVATPGGNGWAQVSLVRWKVKPGGVATGSPALLPGTAGVRQIALGTDASGTNLFVLNPNGAVAWSATLAPAIAGDVVVGAGGTLYAVSGEQSCSGSPCATLNLVQAPSGTGTVATAQGCSYTGAGFKASPSVTQSAGAEYAVVVATSHAAGAKTLFVFQGQGGCAQQSATVLPITGEFTGVSTAPGLAFVSHGAGFTSIAQAGATLDITRTAAFNQSVSLLTAPGISIAGAVNPIFGSDFSDQSVRRAQPGCTTVAPCWQTDPAFTPAKAGAGLPFTPVFDGSTLYAVDDSRLYAWSQASGGAALWSKDLGAPGPPVLLQGAVLEMNKQSGNANLQLITQGNTTTLVRLSTSGALFAPAVDRKDLGVLPGGIAYAPDGQGWLTAVQLPLAPLPASAAVWPRPSRDSCNTRSAGSSCQ